MFGTVRYIITTASVCLMCLHVYGEGEKESKASPIKKSVAGSGCSSKLGEPEEATVDNFRCEKFREGGLTALKNKMLENCDLSRPYTSSLTVFAAEETYLYCCHKKVVQ